MPLQSWLALALTLTGVALTVPDFGVGLSGEAWAGMLIAFVNALAVAVYFILNSRLMRGHESVSRASGWAISGACLTMLLISAARGGVMLPPDARTWLLLLTMALVSTVMPIFMFMVGIQRLGPSRAAILSTVEPIGTLIVATLFLRESVQEIQLVGAALILSSVVLLQWSSRRPEPIPVTAAGD
jgi:drug/metabolite transporter (DMT)-like permease